MNDAVIARSASDAAIQNHEPAADCGAALARGSLCSARNDDAVAVSI
jgi:hypothetical protein